MGMGSGRVGIGSEMARLPVVSTCRDTVGLNWDDGLYAGGLVEDGVRRVHRDCGVAIELHLVEPAVRSCLVCVGKKERGESGEGRAASGGVDILSYTTWHQYRKLVNWRSRSLCSRFLGRGKSRW